MKVEPHEELLLELSMDELGTITNALRNSAEFLNKAIRDLVLKEGPPLGHLEESRDAYRNLADKMDEACGARAFIVDYKD